LFRDAELFPYGNDATSALNRARAKLFVEIFFLKVNPIYYAAVIRGEPNLGKSLVEAINTWLVPVLPDTKFVLGDKFGLAEILVSPFIVRLYLIEKLGILGEGVGAEWAKIDKWSRWTQAVLDNESVKKTFDVDHEARKVVDRVRRVREAKVTAHGASPPKV
jgi:glutathione S-transferase